MNFWERDDNAYRQPPKYQSQYGGNENAQGTETLQDKINEYAGKSQDELMSELLSTANRMKGAGTLTARELDEFYDKVSGFLNEEQRARMRSLIEMLKA